MKKAAIGLVTLGLMMSSPSHAFFGLGDSDSDVTSQITQISDSAQNSSTLISSLTDQLGVSSSQATGGTGALLALASNQLSGSNSEELDGLTSQLGGLVETAQSASSTLDTMSSLNSAFEKLGLDSGMVSQFAPIILEYLSGEGASSSLISSLTSIWK